MSSSYSSRCCFCSIAGCYYNNICPLASLERKGYYATKLDDLVWPARTEKRLGHLQQSPAPCLLAADQI